MKLLNFNCIIIFFSYIFMINAKKNKWEDQAKEAPVKPVQKENQRLLQKEAIKKWGLTHNPATDYNATHWYLTMRKQPQNFFDYYVSNLSKLFLKEGANVNFVMVGACDGTNDNTIRDRFLPNDHWKAVFVEPMDVNYKDLKNFLVNHNVTKRSYTIQAAVTNKCDKPTVTIKFPRYEENGVKIKPENHWLRRQIGGIVTSADKSLDDKDWKISEVRCITGPEIIMEWSEATKRVNPKRKQLKKQKETQKKRIHVLKIDAEGFDFQVLSSFLPESVGQSELPLLINFEAKTMFDNYKVIREILLRRGYAVSNLASDGFAMLKSDKMFNEKRKKVKKNRKVDDVEEMNNEGDIGDGPEDAGGHGADDDTKIK